MAPANSTETLSIRIGKVLARNPYTGARVGFTVAAVPIPLPATDLFLLGALGGLSAPRRCSS